MINNVVKELQKIKPLGSFWSRSTAPLSSLQIKLQGFGDLKFPITPKTAKELIKLAKPAKFGWRDKTILDTEVRDAWEIPKTKLKIVADKWDLELKSILQDVQKQLGLSAGVVLKPDLHNMLVYETGQFFSPHQDSEKLPGMVATLIIELPSSHSGGDLIIDNHGEKKRLQTSKFAVDKLKCIAFYADCQHEVTPISKGYRLVLSYNLVLETGKKPAKIANKSREYTSLSKAVQLYFQQKPEQNQAPKKLIYLLDHDYTQAGLSWQHLKNGDHLKAQALQAVAEDLDLEIYLSLADLHEVWECEESDYHYRSRRSSSRYYDDDLEEPDADSVTTTDLVDEDLSLQHWLDVNNNTQEYGECLALKSAVCWTKATSDFDPFASEYEGFMGNYGNTLERWYHRAALVLWQKQHSYSILMEMDANKTIEKLLKLSRDHNNLSQVNKIIQDILPYWNKKRVNDASKFYVNLLSLCADIGDAKLALGLLQDGSISNFTPKMATNILPLLSIYGSAWCLELFNQWNKPEKFARVNSALEQLSEVVKILSNNKKDPKILSDWLISYQLQTLQQKDKDRKRYDTAAKLLQGVAEHLKKIIDLLLACILANNQSTYFATVDYLIDNPELYPAIDLTQIIYRFEKNLSDSKIDSWGQKKLFTYILNNLKIEQAEGLRSANDWSIANKTSCICADCKMLMTFLQSNIEQEKIWSLNEQRRNHISGQITGMGIAVLFQTKKQGTPYKLLLTKTSALYLNAKKRFKQVEEELRKLLVLLKSR